MNLKKITLINTSRFIQYATALLFAILFSCENEIQESNESNAIPATVIEKLNDAGFYTAEGLSKYEDGYMVEGDIFLTEEDINALGEHQGSSSPNGRVQQYRTNYLVTMPRLITVYMDWGLSTHVSESLNTAIARYNALNLHITFQRIYGSGADINITPVNIPNGFLASAGFPTSNGKPYSSIQVNTYYFTPTTIRTHTPAVLAHELGHCIGFRHTDYMDRSFSCGGSAINEGAAPDGANHIPGTPTGPAISWMNACIVQYVDQNFTTDDVTALQNLYISSAGPVLNSLTNLGSKNVSVNFTPGPGCSSAKISYLNLTTGSLGSTTVSCNSPVTITVGTLGHNYRFWVTSYSPQFPAGKQSNTKEIFVYDKPVITSYPIIASKTIQLNFTPVINCTTTVVTYVDQINGQAGPVSAGSCASPRLITVPIIGHIYRTTITCYSPQFPSGISSDWKDIYVPY